MRFIYSLDNEYVSFNILSHGCSDSKTVGKLTKHVET